MRRHGNKARYAGAAAIALPGVLIATLLNGGAPVEAEPRFALREGVPCSTCHVNPSGGGMRNRYGRYVYAPARLPMGYPTDGRLREVLDVDIGDTLAFGADARTAFIKQLPEDPEAEELETFFLMQADLYVGAHLFDGLTLYYDQGLPGSFEAMVLYEWTFANPSFGGYVKVGRFTPTFGLRLPNHNLYIRQEIGFGPREKDTGLEFGFQLGPFLLQGGVLSGAGAERLIDDNREKAWTARCEWIFRAGRLHLMLGGSFYSNVTGNLTESQGTRLDTRVENRRVGGHWGVALGRFAYLGEIDRIWVDPSEDAATVEEDSLRLYNELDILLVRGLEIFFTYEYRDPDVVLASGTAHRLGAGLALFPMPQLEIFALYRHVFASGRDEGANDGFDEIITMLHAFF